MSSVAVLAEAREGVGRAGSMDHGPAWSGRRVRRVGTYPPQKPILTGMNVAEAIRLP